MRTARTLAAEPESVRRARDVVTVALMDAPCTPPVIEVARLLVSELATNAVNHARSSSFTVAIDVDEVTASISVHDDTPGSLAVPPEPAPAAEHGRGLRLVEELALRWWCTQEGDPPGKTVGFALRCG
jgi:anti-sigma regulatory factor (Ser/Thr protein kinase)